MATGESAAVARVGPCLIHSRAWDHSFADGVTVVVDDAVDDPVGNTLGDVVGNRAGDVLADELATDAGP